MKKCAIEGCDRPKGWHQWCKTHGARWKKYGDPLFKKIPGVHYNVKGSCEIEGCEKPYQARGYCNMHYTRFMKHGDPHRVDPITGRPWKGDQPSFDAIHKRIWRVRGSAKNYQCVDCGGAAQEWSYEGGCPNELKGKARNSIVPFSEDLSLYKPRCIRCHRVYDKAGEGRLRDENGRFI